MYRIDVFEQSVRFSESPNISKTFAFTNSQIYAYSRRSQSCLISCSSTRLCAFSDRSDVSLCRRRQFLFLAAWVSYFDFVLADVY